MPDYQELYLKLFRANEAAIRLLITAQQECEAYYLNHAETPITVLPNISEKIRPSSIDQNPPIFENCTDQSP